MWTELEITNREGEKLEHAFHPGSTENVLVILGHGLSGNKDRPLLVALANGISALGWPCLRISYSGNGGSDGDFTKSCPTKEIADLQSVLDLVPHEVRVAYIGHSMGGAVGVLTAARDSRVHGLVTLAGMADMVGFLKREFSDLTPGAGFMWDDESLPYSQIFADDLTQIENTFSAAEAVTQPWLVIHAADDDLVPIQDSRDAFAKAGGEKAWLEISHAGHSFDESSHPQIVQAIQEWLKTSLHFPLKENPYSPVLAQIISTP